MQSSQLRKLHMICVLQIDKRNSGKGAVCLKGLGTFGTPSQAGSPLARSPLLSEPEQAHQCAALAITDHGGPEFSLCCLPQLLEKQMWGLSTTDHHRNIGEHSMAREQFASSAPNMQRTALMCFSNLHENFRDTAHIPVVLPLKLSFP